FAAETLLHLFDAPQTAWVDNAALVFSPDGRELVYSGSSATKGQARRWDLATGEVKRAWTFAPGVNNRLAFHPTGRLLLFQLETRDGKHIPDSSVDLRRNPLVYRIRDLLGDPGKPLVEITEFDFIEWPVIPTDGHLVALIGYRADGRGK